MKIAAAFLLCALLFFGTSAQEECSFITEEELETVFVNEVAVIIPEGVDPPQSVQLVRYNFSCLAPGRSRGMYRSLTVTAEVVYLLVNTESRTVFLLDIACVTIGNMVRWSPVSTVGSALLTDPSQIDFYLSTKAFTKCSECNGLNGDQTYHCVGM